MKNRHGTKFCAVCLAALMSMSSAAIPVMAATDTTSSSNPECADLLDQDTKDKINGVIDFINSFAGNSNSDNNSGSNDNKNQNDNNTSNNNQGTDNNQNNTQPVDNSNIKVTKTHTVEDMINNIDKYVSGVTNKEVVYGAKNVNLADNVKILDPKSVKAVIVDTSGVEWDKLGTWPIKFTICFKPAKNDNSDLDKIDQTDYHRNPSANYVYTDLANNLKDNEYVALDIIKSVGIGKVEYYNNSHIKEELAHTKIYTDNSKQYDFTQTVDNAEPGSDNGVKIQYIGAHGDFISKSVKVTKSFQYVTGEAGYYCAKCHKRFCSHGKNRYGTEYDTESGIEDHEGSYCKSNWITFDETDTKFYSPGDDFTLTIWQTK